MDGALRTEPGRVRAQALARLGRTEDGRLAVGGVAAADLVARFGSPLYAFDAGIVREQWSAVRRALGTRVSVLYCLKANPSLALARLLLQSGSGAEVASAGEIHLALAAGQDPRDLHFAGPGKSRTDLERAVAVGLGSVNLESAAEYEALAGLCRERGRRAGVALRVNPRQAVKGSRMSMGGGSRKFGVDADDVPDLARRIVQEDLLDLHGLHVYAGTQCFDAEAWLDNARALLETAREVEDAIHRPLAVINFGGGFGIPYYDSDPTFDLERAGRGVQELIAADARAERRYCVELGRYLVAPCGVYLARVLYLKESQGRWHAILDGGLHHHGAAAGVGAVIRRPFPIVHCDRLDAPHDVSYTLGGPLCTPQDELAAQVNLPRLQPGDLLAFLSSGAYGLTFSSTLFLSHPTPAEVLVDGGTASLVREAGRPEDVLRGQHLPGGETA